MHPGPPLNQPLVQHAHSTICPQGSLVPLSGGGGAITSGPAATSVSYADGSSGLPDRITHLEAAVNQLQGRSNAHPVHSTLEELDFNKQLRCASMHGELSAACSPPSKRPATIASLSLMMPVLTPPGFHGCFHLSKLLSFTLPPTSVTSMMLSS